MKDCSSEITSFYNKHVRLSKDEVDNLASYRETNKKRVENGLKNADKPLPDRHINQGSYAMRTINQHPDNDYDIDIGIVFKKDDLVGAQGADKTALDTRKMVCNAIRDKKFKKQPIVKKNCVRVFYDEGYHVDMPIYREEENNGTKKIELASSEWIESEPEAVTKWFNDAVIDKSPDETNGRQMRRIVRLLKFWSKSRSSWNMLSGFIISKLVDEHYVSVKDRDDESLYRTMVKIRDRLLWNKNVYHPILTDVLISEGKEAAIDEMKDQLDTAIENLNDLFDDECSKENALKIWKKFFNHDFFKDILQNSSAKAAIIATQIPQRPVDKKGGGRFG